MESYSGQIEIKVSRLPLIALAEAKSAKTAICSAAMAIEYFILLVVVIVSFFSNLFASFSEKSHRYPKIEVKINLKKVEKCTDIKDVDYYLAKKYH